jgi:Domain of unknown function (DUF4382)
MFSVQFTIRSRTIEVLLARLCVGLLVCFIFTGCGDTCVVVTGIFPNASSPTNPPSCQLGNGGITVAFRSVASSAAVASTPNLQHLFVTLRGIEANSSALATADSPDWQQLAPDLADHPVQIDLMEAPALGARCPPPLIHNSSFRAGVYRQIRLQLVPDAPAGVDVSFQKNACQGDGLQCIVAMNGQIHPMALVKGGADIVIAANHIANGSFNVLPDTETRLSIEFNSFASLATPDGDAVRIAPAFSVDSDAVCDSASASP